MSKIKKAANNLVRAEEGAQVIEYALIIAVVALTFVIGLRDVTGTNFSGFINRVATCLSSATSCS